jgi:undecaprenyl-diphosphatase
VNATTRTSWLWTTWPLDRRDWLRLGIGLGVVIGAFAAVGWLYTDLLAPNWVTAFDDDVAQWFVDTRTDRRSDIAHWGVMLAETHIKIGITCVAVVVMIAVWRRWHEAAFLAVSLIVEATAFIVITFIVGRARPAVPRLLDSPVDSSYPSGHVAAATVYGAFVVIVFWHNRNVWVRGGACAACALIVVAVGMARMYQGMHHFTDVLAGVLLGLVSLGVCVRVFGLPSSSDGRRRDARGDPPVRSGVLAAS